MRKPEICDNVRVRTLSYGAEYFQVVLRDVERDEDPDAHVPWHVSINSYCVPGRIDSYNFTLVPATPGRIERLCFCSEGGVGLLKAVAMFQKDIDKPQVKEMLMKMVGAHWSAVPMRENLIAELAPKSKTLRAMRRKSAQIRKKMKEEYEKKNQAQKTS